MSASNLKEVLHSSNLVMKPFVRLVILGYWGFIGYSLLTPAKTVERIPPNYEEYRRLTGLPPTKIKHPGWFCKELRIVPKEEDRPIAN